MDGFHEPKTHILAVEITRVRHDRVVDHIFAPTWERFSALHHEKSMRQQCLSRQRASYVIVKIVPTVAIIARVGT